MKKNIYIFFLVLLITNYSFSQGYWTQKANLSSTARGDAFCFSIGNKGYVGSGGDYNWNQLQDFWEWDQTINTWTQKATFVGVARWQSVSFSIGTKGYVCSGQGSLGQYNDLWEYNTVTNLWVQKTSLPAIARNAAVGFSINNKGYLCTGINNGIFKKDFPNHASIITV